MFWKRKNYVFVYKIKQEDFAKQKILNEKVLIKIKRFLMFRLRNVNYYEPVTINEQSYVFIGNIVRKDLIAKCFFYELYANLKDENFKITVKQYSICELGININYYKF